MLAEFGGLGVVIGHMLGVKDRQRGLDMGQRALVHFGGEGQAGATIAQAVGVELILIAQSTTGGFQRVDAGEAVGGGGEDFDLRGVAIKRDGVVKEGDQSGDPLFRPLLLKGRDQALGTEALMFMAVLQQRFDPLDVDPGKVRRIAERGECCLGRRVTGALGAGFCEE